MRELSSRLSHRSRSGDSRSSTSRTRRRNRHSRQSASRICSGPSEKPFAYSTTLSINRLAAALAVGIAKNQAFPDANKRTAWVYLRLIFGTQRSRRGFRWCRGCERDASGGRWQTRRGRIRALAGQRSPGRFPSLIVQGNRKDQRQRGAGIPQAGEMPESVRRRRIESTFSKILYLASESMV